MSQRNDYKEFFKLVDQMKTGKKIKPEIEHNFIPDHGKPLAIIVDGILKEIYISQSFIKEIAFKWEERPDVCPWRIYNTWVLRIFKRDPSDAMLYGEYFETKILGRGARGKMLSLPGNKRTGTKRVAHERIDEAVIRFNKVKEETGIIVTNRNVQVRRETPWLDSSDEIKVYLHGTADIISPFLYDYGGNIMEFDVAVLDTKLTSDRDVCYQDKNKPWGSFCWGCPEKMDHLQGIFYSTLFELPFLYLIFDYRKDNPGWKPVAVNNIMLNPDNPEAKLRQKEFERGINWTVETIKGYYATGWPKCPGDWCLKCPVLTCEFKNKMQTV